MSVGPLPKEEGRGVGLGEPRTALGSVVGDLWRHVVVPVVLSYATVMPGDARC